MCVTNTTYRRQQAISLPQQQQQQPQHNVSAQTNSGLTQRLLSTFQLPSSRTQPSFGATTSSSNAAEFSVFPNKDMNASNMLPIPNKPRPKRRRKPQKPGKTAKMNDRHFVVHNYHDHAMDDADEHEDSNTTNVSSGNAAQHEEHHQRRKGGVAVAFPLKLHAVLDQVEADGLGHVMSWSPHGRCFVIHKPKEFTEHVMPKYFRQTKLTSFQRQLNLYGFSRLTRGPDASGYYHELFLRGKTHLCKRMVRTKVKGTKFKAASSPDQEPDFYKMPPVLVSPPATSDEEMSHGDASSHSGAMSLTSTTTSSTLPQPQVVQAPTSSSPSMLYSSNAPSGALSSFSLEPLPLSFTVAQQQQQQPPVQYASVTAPIPPPAAAAASSFAFDFEADQILDQAVDELFLQEGGASSTDLTDFCNEWGQPQPQQQSTTATTAPLNTAFAESLENDKQLGFMLEKLLEDY